MDTESLAQVISTQFRLRLAELARAPQLLGRVVPTLVAARWTGRESVLELLLGQVRRRPDATALLCGRERHTFRELHERVERAAALLEARGLGAGQVVGLLGTNSDDYVVQLLAIARLGAVVALLSPELSGEGVAHALSAARASALLISESCAAKAPSGISRVEIYDSTTFRAQLLVAPSSARVSALPRAEQDFAYVYTSGTTGPSKPARVSHRRAFLAATVFGQLVHGLRPDDVLYCALPLHHTSALLLGLGACLQTGAALALRERFSASALLDDVRRFDASVLLYIGELGRALLATPPSPNDRAHRLRLAVGNGLSAEVWGALQQRFGIREVREFYAATEFPGAIVNLIGTRGSVGHVPLERLRGYRLVRVDHVSGDLVRNAGGRAIECTAGEPGELVLRLRGRVGQELGDYQGYVDVDQTQSRIARDLFEAGDVYCRSGDLLKRDRAGQYWFVDRLGDTFRFKGENVATCEVEAAFAGLPGLTAVAVGVRVPAMDGQPGLLVVTCEGELDLEELSQRAARLPHYARPCFVRHLAAFDMTRSLKVKKRGLSAQGVDPGRLSDPLYYWDGQRYASLGAADWARIVSGKQRF